MTPLEQRLQQLLSPVQDGMERMREVVAQQLSSEAASVAEMTEHLSRFQGKQLRAALVLLSAEATGNDCEELPVVAGIVEMIHLATLVHDDVLDGAKVRRRVDCVNERWDNQVAVLLGDLLYARAFHLSTTLSSTLTSRLLSVTTQEICEGEIEQAAARYDFEMGREDYERIAAAKTAVLYRTACELGARYGRGDEYSLGAEMAAFGFELGLAFQIVDDVLDLVGSEEVVGKSVGSDAEGGKVTLPVLLTYQDADEVTRTRMRDAYTQPGLEQRAAHLAQVCDLDEGVEAALARARELSQRAMQRLQGLQPGPARDALALLGDYVLERKW